MHLTFGDNSGFRTKPVSRKLCKWKVLYYRYFCLYQFPSERCTKQLIDAIQNISGEVLKNAARISSLAFVKCTILPKETLWEGILFQRDPLIFLDKIPLKIPNDSTQEIVITIYELIRVLPWKLLYLKRTFRLSFWGACWKPEDALLPSCIILKRPRHPFRA